MFIGGDVGEVWMVYYIVDVIVVDDWCDSKLVWVGLVCLVGFVVVVIIIGMVVDGLVILLIMLIIGYSIWLGVMII